MRIRDWSSDVCSSDLKTAVTGWSPAEPIRQGAGLMFQQTAIPEDLASTAFRPASAGAAPDKAPGPDRKRVVSGKRVSVRVDLGGRRIIKKKKKQHITFT